MSLLTCITPISRQCIYTVALCAFALSAPVAFAAPVNSAAITDTSADVAAVGASRADTFLGDGFEKAGLTGTATNPLVEQRGGGFAEGGIGEINALLYNVKDAFKYIVGSMAVLWFMIAAFQMVTAMDDDTISGARKSMIWSAIGVIAVFLVDMIVVALFEGGSIADTGNVGAHLVDPATGTFATSLANSITTYLMTDVRAAFEFLKVWGGGIAVLFLFINGFRLVTANGDEDAITKAKTYAIHIIIAFVAFFLIDTLIFGVIYPVQSGAQFSPECVAYLQHATQSGVIDFSQSTQIVQADGTVVTCQSAAELAKRGTSEVLGIIRFFETVVGALAVAYIVYAGVRIIAAFGDDDTIGKYKKGVVVSLSGIAVILLSESVVMRFFFTTDFNTGTTRVNLQQAFIDIAGVVNFLITFVSIFSLLTMIIAGGMWVIDFGNSDLAGKAKKALIAAVLGIVLSMSAYALTNTLLSGRTTGESQPQYSMTAQP